MIHSLELMSWFKHILLYQYTKGLGMATLRHKPSPELMSWVLLSISLELKRHPNNWISNSTSQKTKCW